MPLGADKLPDPYPVRAWEAGSAPFSARVRPPGSKSVTNRAILLAALARGRSVLERPLLRADDAERMIAGVRALGAEVRETAEGNLEVEGVGGRWPCGDVRLDLGNSGTSVRFLSAAALLAPGPVTIDGNERMRERPIGELGEALEALGARVDYLGETGTPPLRITPPTRLTTSATVTLPTTVSSQFVSALLLVAPFLPGGLTVTLEGRITSRSYVMMTAGLLDQVGAVVKTTESLSLIRVGGGAGGGAERAGLDAFRLTIEPDASGATYFWAAASLRPGAVCRVEGLDARSMQGDANFPDLLSRMGAAVLREEGATPSLGVRGPGSLSPIMADLSLMPDAAMTLASVACFAKGMSVLRGLRTLRAKETDRIAAMEREMAKIGVKVEGQVLGDSDSITITPPKGGVDCSAGSGRVEFETYDDHRMAMSLALIGLRRPNVWIRNPGCVAKTYPNFWRDLAALG
ncbi:MAG: 3-phosphoshikimate 1-carboxyvinyltransferase [Phycisphaerae bacterium]|nr:3-phosphoshikimate 1-carboxyvinyltransferase [Phycisphaerae bacterium]